MVSWCTITEGNELVSQLDLLTLSPHSQQTRACEVQHKKLTIILRRHDRPSGSSALDVLVHDSA